MKRLFLAIGILLIACISALAIIAARMGVKVRQNTALGPVEVGGLIPGDADAKLQAWWDSQKDRELTFRIPGRPGGIQVQVAKLGMAPDDTATLKALPVTDFWSSARQVVGAGGSHTNIPIVFKRVAPMPRALATFVDEAAEKRHPARVLYSEKGMTSQPEQSGLSLDESALAERVVAALQEGNQSVEIPLKQAPKQIPDDALNQITDLESAFTTHFPTYKVDRNTNIRIAAGKINGIVIPPGGRFSFNTVVGRRTIEDGYKTAPVFKNGKHDVGVGGGICQVSSTLYNAALLADLKIVERHNHSLPVAYLPAGRDATVDYGSLDLVLENNQTGPIALSSEYKAGALTFRVLGKKDPGLKVQISSSGAEYFDLQAQTVHDPNLPVGSTKVLEKGSRGKAVNTYRVVYRNGEQVVREALGRSVYKGSPRVVAVGSKAVSKTSDAVGKMQDGGKKDMPPKPSAAPPIEH